MKKLKAFIAAFLIAISGGVVGLTGFALAATSSGNGMKVSPVRTDLTIKPGESRTVSVFVQNVTNGDETLRVITNDFTAKDESGAPSLLLNGTANPKHGLKQYLSTPEFVSVPAGQQKEVKVSVNIPAGAAGGGYYGAVRFAPGSVSQADAEKNVSLSGSVGSLVLVSVPGKITENMQVASFDARKGNNASTIFTSAKDLTATVRFRNNGNIQEQPFGKILLKKGDKTIGTYEINNGDAKGNVLPDSIRRFDTKLTGVGSFGKYTIQGNFGYGDSGKLLSASTSFYVIPMFAIVLGVVVLVLLVLALVVLPKFIKNYNQRILRRAGRR
jgi:hypothetical protein